MNLNPETRKDYTLDIGKVNLYALLLVVPITAIYLGPFLLIWDFETFEVGRKQFMGLFVFVFIFGIIIHELLHGATWALFAKRGFRSIKFGINTLTPYCHCKEPLRVKHYKIGGAMPLIVMGIVPAVAGLILGNGLFLSLGIFFTWTAGGDIIALYMLRKLNKETRVADHPEKMGFYVLD